MSEKNYFWYNDKLLSMAFSIIPEESKKFIDEYIEYNEIGQSMDLILYHINEANFFSEEINSVILDFLWKYPPNWFDVDKKRADEIIRKINDYE